MRAPSLAAAQAAKALAASHRETAASKERRIEELEERARLFGDSVKQSAAAKKIEGKWLRFLLVHGVKYGFKQSRGPTVIVKFGLEGGVERGLGLPAHKGGP